VARVKQPEPPVIDYRPPASPPPEGRDFTVRANIKSDSPIGRALLQWGPQGGQMVYTDLTHTDGDSYEAVVPAAQAKGTIQYFIAAKNAAGLLTKQGASGQTTPYTITFKPVAAQPASTAVASSGPYQFSHLPLYRVIPGKPIVVRAQVVPTSDSGELPDRVIVLWRGNDAQDQLTEMDADPRGGWGGYKAQLPPQEDGAIFYQIVACDAAGKACGDDTGSKRKWHSAMVSAQPGGAQPMPLDAVSSKAPASVPE
jgi:hypothetical protein